MTSENFTVWTDASAEQARALIQTMEHLRQVVYGVSFFRPVAPSRCIVIALANVEEVHAYVPPQFVAYTWDPRNPFMQPVIVLPMDDLEDDQRIITHELTHAISYGAIPNQPHWFAEGLATYFETVRLDRAHGSVDVGVPLDFRVRELRAERPLPLASLFACVEPSCMTDRYYASVWAAFSYLMNQHPDELMKYMLQLIEQPQRDDAVAWSSVFGALTPEVFDRDLAGWLAHGSTRVRQYKVEARDWPVEQRKLGDADVYAARAFMSFMFHRAGPVPPELLQAVAADPVNVLARLLETARDGGISPSVAHRVEEAHPDDWRAWMLVLIATNGTPEAAAARQKVCELFSKNPGVLTKGACSQ